MSDNIGYLLSHFTSFQDNDASNNAAIYSVSPEPVLVKFNPCDK